MTKAKTDFEHAHQRQPLFRVPQRPAGQKLSLGLMQPMWETVSGSFLKAVLAEFFCTSIFIYCATGTVVFGCHSSDNSTTSASAATGQVVAPEDCFLSNSRVLTIATAFGFNIAVLVYCAASFSGGHLNPAVTLAFVISKKITAMRAFAYWCAQLSGAILGSALVYATDRTGWHAATGGTNRLLPGISKASGWLLETILTMLLVFVVLSATDSSRARISTHLPVLAPLAIGLAVFIAHLAAVALDGCSINPARSFGPAVVSGVWTDQWIFWAGPFSGALLAVFLYELFFRPSGHMQVETHEHHVDDKGHHDVELGAGPPQTIQLPAFSGVRGNRAAEPRREMMKVAPPPANVTPIPEGGSTTGGTATQHTRVQQVAPVHDDGAA